MAQSDGDRPLGVQHVPEGIDLSPARRLLDRHRSAVYPLTQVFGGVRLTINREVFSPLFTNTSRFLLQHIEFTGPGTTVADIFTGSGAFALVAAKRGAAVVAVDNSSAAVACAQSNVDDTLLGSLVEVRHGTCVTAIGSHERFHLIIANPPLLPGDPQGALEAALFDCDLQGTYEFLNWVPSHLTRRGSALILTSSVMDSVGLSVSEVAQALGLSCELMGELGVGYETYRVHRLRLGWALDSD